jgi:hypothetical protein
LLLFKHLFLFVFILFQSIVGHKKLPRGPPVWHPWSIGLFGFRTYNTWMRSKCEIIFYEIGWLIQKQIMPWATRIWLTCLMFGAFGSRWSLCSVCSFNRHWRRATSIQMPVTWPCDAFWYLLHTDCYLFTLNCRVVLRVFFCHMNRFCTSFHLIPLALQTKAVGYQEH